jgi:hypothetical protein
MDPRYYVIAAWLSSFTHPAKQSELPEATFKPFELSNLQSAS